MSGSGTKAGVAGEDAAAPARAESGGQPLTVLSVMLQSAEYLSGKGIESARLDAEYMLAHVMGVGRLEMYMQHERPVTDAELERFRPLLRRRSKREPLQYVLGHQAFREMELEVGSGVLIPRPETEQLVDVVLKWARNREELEALDVGTGSGAIALALLTEGPFSRCVGLDASGEALAFARRNRDELGLGSRLELREGTLFQPVADGEHFDVVVSNPPYVAESERDALEVEVAEWEPEEALFAGPDGLDVLRELVPGAVDVLRSGGLLAVEVGEGQAEAVVALVEGSGAYDGIQVHEDLTGRRRIVTAEAVGRDRDDTRSSAGD